MNKFAAVTALTMSLGFHSFAHSLSDADLARKLTNPVAPVILLQFKLDYDHKIGPREEGERNTLQLKPIVPFSLNDDWILVSRTNFYVLDQTDIFPGAGSQTGIGDIEESLFLTPAKSSAGGWEWSAGPAFSLRTASNDKLGTGKWGLGPTALLLRQEGHFTYGVLSKQIWSVAGDDQRADVSKLDFQPFFNYVLGKTTYGLFLDSTYDWESDRWTFPINLTVSQLFSFGDQRVRLLGGVRYWAVGTDIDPKGWGARISITFIFPKRTR